MKKKMFPLIVAILSLITSSVFADSDPYLQYLPEYMPQSPNSQAIARAVDIPVNYYIGVPNITIPLYEIKAGSVSLPITLSYQGGGIRPSQEATSVGLGWSLSAGGSITRTVKCADDFMEYNVPDCQFTVGFLGRTVWPDFSINFDNNYYGSIFQGFDGTGTSIWTNYLYVDSEPDLYFYSIPSCSGKFSFMRDHSIVQFDRSNKLEINADLGSRCFYIIDAQGNSYWFETKEITEVYCGGNGHDVNTTIGGVDVTAFGPNDNLTQVSAYTSTWFLTKIFSSANDTIDFEYEDEDFLLPLQEECRYMRRIEGAALGMEGDGPRYSHTKTYVDTKRLSRITWRGGHAEFEYDTGRTDLIGTAKALTNVKVFNTNNLLVSHWKMSYDYFNGDMTNVANNRKHLFKRLRLTSLKNMLDGQDPYRFTYYDEVPMPLKNTKNLDYWGYYNGVDQGSNYYCPAVNGITSSYKSANDYYSKIGILESIEHPTGGTTNLYWESNKIGESVTVEGSMNGDSHDSYSQGCLRTQMGGSTGNEDTRAVLLTDSTEIYLLLSTEYHGNQPSTTSVGTPFTISEIHENGTKTIRHSWSAGRVSDEVEHTIVLSPGIYEFKCTAVANDMEFCMFFIDSMKKLSVKKNNKDFVLCCRDTEQATYPETDSMTITLEREEIVFLKYFCAPIYENSPTSLPSAHPFRIQKMRSDGTYENLTGWTVDSMNHDEVRTLHLDVGTYKLLCGADIDNILFYLAIEYGQINYSPIDYSTLDNGWQTQVLISYNEGLVSNDLNLLEEESDTIVLAGPAHFYISGIYEKKTGGSTPTGFLNTCPLSIYKQAELGGFEKLFSIPAYFLTDFEESEKEPYGLYLEEGTYIIKCEATVEDVVFCGTFVYREDVVYSSNGANRGGLRIARIRGEKDVKYFYEGGKDIIPPCTYYKEQKRYEEEGIYKTVTYEVRPSESVRPLSTLKNGNVTGYSRVVEVYADKSRTEYTYHNEEEELEDADFPYSPTDTDWENGLMLTHTVFNAVGDTVHQTSNAYMQVLTQASYRAGFIEVWPGYNVNYYRKVVCPMLRNSVITDYRDNGKIVTRKAYQYNDNLVCTEESSQIGSDVHKTIYKYANDFSDDVSELMVQTHRIGIPVVQLSMRNGVIYDGTRTVFGNFNDLTDNGNTVICGNPTWYTEMYLPKYLLTLNTSNSASSFSACMFDTAIVYNSYTQHGNVRELRYKGMPMTYIWSYNGTCPLAEYKNVTYQQYKSFYAGGNLDNEIAIYQDPEFIRDKLLNVVGNLSDASVTVCLYSPLVGVTEMTDNLGRCYAYDYDAAGRLLFSKQLVDSHSSYIPLQLYTYGKNVVTSKSYPNRYEQGTVSSIQYYDKWGRPSVLAAQGAMQNACFSYGMQTYDWKGRPFKSYVAVPSNSSNGELLDIDDFVDLSASTFSGDPTSFFQTSYDVADRTIAITMPGMAWFTNKKSTTCQYKTNAPGEVKRYNTSGTTITQAGYYPAGTLDCTVTTDPDGQTVKSYKDVFGNVVLERRAGNYDTYYVYDNLNRLRFVLPPKYQEENRLDYYAYQYEYDGRGRISKKKLPGCSPVQYWYDSRDRLIKMQDGILAQTGCYRTWSYDALDRPLSQGIQSTGNLYYDEVRNYYDDYSFTSNYSSLIPSGVSNVVPINHIYGKGQLTGCWQRASNGEGMLSILGYDEMGYVAKKSEMGLGRQMSISDYTNNTLGKVTQENFRKYKPTANGTMQCIASGTIQNNYNYLHTNLLTSSVITITDKNGSMRTDTIQHLMYDDFGHVMTNDRGGTAADMTYGYDQMHGWLKSIKSGGRFEQKLYREMEGSTPCYNGNISAMTWRTGNDYVRRFDYQYNQMNWLSQANFSYYSIGNPNSPSPTLSLIPYVGMDHEDYTSEYYYDKNGNLTGAYRQGLVGDLYDEDEYSVYDTMDDYNVEYYGNQCRSVNGSGTGTPSYYGSSSFVDGVEDGDDEYAYNANGAMTMDLNKGITNISYDLLNNIREVTFSGNRSILYTYAADGTRLRTVHSRKVGNTWLKDSTDYCGSLILQNGAPSMYQFAGGYISFTNSALSGCHYYIQDYLGNNRMVVNKTGAVEQTTHYYPYGGVIGGIDFNPGFQKYKFGGKELDRAYGLDWYDVQARQYDPVHCRWDRIDPLCEKYYGISPYVNCENNPVNAIDTDGKKGILIHGTWSDNETWEDVNGIQNATNNLFNDGNIRFAFKWSGGNYRSMRTEAATKLVNYLQSIIKTDDFKGNEPITLIGHSHGGNVAIEAVNMMVKMKEFDGRDINILTINTPVRDDYQLSETSQERVNHVNVYDDSDPVQISGGNTYTIGKPSTNYGGEFGSAGRVFKNARNIKVDDPQGIIRNVKTPTSSYYYLNFNFHNSHNRVNTWINKTK